MQYGMFNATYVLINRHPMINFIYVKSTFFFLLRSSFYNTISNQNYNAIKKIISLGHTIGLHFDASIYGNKDLDANCKKEISILEKIFDIKIDIVSFHRPVKSLIKA